LLICQPLTTGTLQNRGQECMRVLGCKLFRRGMGGVTEELLYKVVTALANTAALLSMLLLLAALTAPEQSEAAPGCWHGFCV